MAEESAKLRIPYIAAAQAQKHVTHNEAMTVLDTLVQLSVIDKDLTAPPGSPVEGDTYIVAADGTGAWIGWDKRIARFIDGTWRSYLPGEGDGAGWLAYVIDEETLYVFTGTDWEQLFVAEGHSGVSSVNGEAGDVSLGLDDLDDVDAASPGDGHVLTWDHGAGAWIPAAPSGGEPATLEPEGEWDEGATYAKLDVVSYEGASYLSRIDDNTGHQPDESPDEWMLLAAPGVGAGNVNTAGAPVAAGNLVQYEDASGTVIEDSGIAAANILVAADIGAAVQAYDADLAAVAALSANGLIARTGAGTAAARSVAVTASTGLQVTNGDGVSGNPTLAGLDATTSVKGVAEFATAAEFRAGTDAARALVVSEVWSGPTLQTLSSASNSTAVNFADFLNAALALSENTTLADPSNEKVGQCGAIIVTATGATRTVSLHADYKPANGIEPFPIAVPTTETIAIHYWIETANVVWITAVQRRTT